jgi:hypothetical protein
MSWNAVASPCWALAGATVFSASCSQCNSRATSASRARGSVRLSMPKLHACSLFVLYPLFFMCVQASEVIEHLMDLNHRHRSNRGCDHRDRKCRHGAGRRITNAMYTLVRSTKPIPPGASAVHHIVDEDVANAPAFSEAIDRFKGADFYVAHNCEFERSFFAAQGIELGPWICTYKCALRVWPEFEGHSNQKLALHTRFSLRQVPRPALCRHCRQRSRVSAMDCREIRARGRHQIQRSPLVGTGWQVRHL